MIPRATYRLQLNAGFTFSDAEAIVPYLDSLGISHVYTSPITTARSGSTHGYDVVDPTRINPELGGEPAFRSLVTKLRDRDMGMIIDIVPNHMGVVGGENAWWNDVLAKGQVSEYARYFDIDWSTRLMLPVLGEPLEAALASGSIEASEHHGRYVLVAYGEHHFPIRDEDKHVAASSTTPESLRALLDRQHYRLASWRTANDDLNWRRFFAINELVGLRIEDSIVFERTHALYFRLYSEGLIDGVRVDHVDGLTDPACYCRNLRSRLDAITRPATAPPAPAYIVVEKILARGEQLAADWGVDGTSGYDFMEDVSALLHSEEGDEALGKLWTDLSNRPAKFEFEELQARQDILAWQFDGQLTRCVAAFESLAASTEQVDGVTSGMFRRAIERLLWVWPVYRTYGDGRSAPASDGRVRMLAKQRVARFSPPGEAWITDMILAWLAGGGAGDLELAGEAVRRFQQLSSPIAAKSVEDTAFYRHGKLLSRMDVGFDAQRLSMPIADFHRIAVARSEQFPHAMLATATHDHKRGEDMRARLAVLSELPVSWGECVARWNDQTAVVGNGIDPADRYILYQTLYGAWPQGLPADDKDGLSGYATRVVAWQQKALREAKLRSSWEAPDNDYEARCKYVVETLLDPDRSPEFLNDLRAFVSSTDAAARANMLVQVALRHTIPGMPDLYQGTEISDFSLVDPDNRRPVNFDLRKQMLGGQDAPGASGCHEKLSMIALMLDLRRHHAQLFAEGDYQPLEVGGRRAAHVLAFRRTLGRQSLTCIVALRCAKVLTGQTSLIPPASWWADTALRIEGNAALPDASMETLLKTGPVYVNITSR